MEGIIDFGMAGLRKGLRLTGLQDNIISTGHECKKFTGPMDKKQPVKLTKLSHVTSEEVKITTTESSVVVTEESAWVNPLGKDSPNFDGHILLEKTPGSASKSFSNELNKLKENVSDILNVGGDFMIKHDIPHIISTDSTDSPDPEYEETADLATSIAKLRSLLQQKSSESNLTTPALSPMPEDCLKTTPIDPPPPPTAEFSEVDGMMPSLYKFCARTATGVFHNTLNTIKTALPRNAAEIEQQLSLLEDGRERWTFIEADADPDDLLPKMEKLLKERQVFCTVDTAYEAVDSLETLDQVGEKYLDETPVFDDELDDFEATTPITRILVDILCELIAETNSFISREPIVRSLLLLLGVALENRIDDAVEKFVKNINQYVGRLPTAYSQNVKPMKLEQMVGACSGALPAFLYNILSKNSAEEALCFLLLSLQHQRINEDVLMQISELIGAQLIHAGSKMSPAFSA